MTAVAVADPVPADPPVDPGAFFDVSLDMLVIRDMDGVVLKASQSWETTLGWRADELEGTRLLRLVHPDDLAQTLDSVVEVESRRPGDQVRGQINRYRHRDGSYRTLEWRAHRFGDRIYGVARDVTDRVAAERAVVEAKAAAEAASRAKSDFLANMSHEIRTPLNGVIGLAGVLAQMRLDPEQASIVQMITDSSATLERLVSDLLDMAKIEAGRISIEAAPFNLADVVSAAGAPHRVQAQIKNLAFDLRMSDRAAAARLVGDSTRLAQILANLLSNAVKFTDAGGVSAHIDLTADGDRERLRIEVVDTGVGFAPGFMDQIFERFTQADDSITRRFGGTGLGLSICRALAELMDGDIRAEPRPEGGSRMVVTLALPRDVAPAPSVYKAVTAMPAGLRVLLAEDHPVNQQVVQLILGAVGAEIETVADGVAAVEAFKAAAFDVILMDMQMPVMDGLAATQAIRAHEAQAGSQATPIIMLTANAMGRHRQEARLAGADLHLAKPITPDRLLEGIGRVIAV